MSANLEMLEKQGLSCSFLITISDTDIKSKSKKIVRDYFKTHTPRGFRKDKIPVSFIDTKATEARASVLTEMIGERVNKAIKDESINLYSEPDIELLENDAGKDVVCKVSAITTPELDFNLFADASSKSINCNITEEHINRSFSRLLDDFSTWKPQAKSLEDNDGVTLTIKGLDEDFPVSIRLDHANEEARSYTIKCIEAAVAKQRPQAEKLSEMAEKIAELLDGFIGKEKGVEKALPKFKGIKVELQDVNSIERPEINEKFFASVGMPNSTEAEFRDSLRELLEFQLNKKLESFYQKEFVSFCDKTFDFQIPDALLEQESQRLKSEDGSDIDVASRIRFNMVLSSIISQGKVDIDENQVQKELYFQSRYNFDMSNNSKFNKIMQDYARNTVMTAQAIDFARNKMQEQIVEVEYDNIDNYLKENMED